MPSPPENESRLKGLRVLIVEDDTLVAMLIEEYVSELGCSVAGSARRLSRALEIIESDEIDAAILDRNVAGESVIPLAEILRQRSVPFVFASGYGDMEQSKDFSQYPALQKPFTMDDLRAALLKALTA